MRPGVRAVWDCGADDGPLDEDGKRQARAARPRLPPASRHLSGTPRQCQETTVELGLDATTDAALRELDPGTWRGRALDELAAREPEDLTAWTADPAAAPHGGESVLQLCGRIADWLDDLPETMGRTPAVTAPSVARASVVHALTAPPLAFWRIDVPPLACVHLTGRAGRWNLRFA